jgi:heat shock protein HslJ
MIRKSLIAVAIAVATLQWGPAASADPIAPPDDPVGPSIAGTSWQFVEIAGTASPESMQPTLELSADGAATGYTGCNTFSGRYVSDGANLSFSDLGYTKMWCEAEVMTVERAVQSALTSTSNMATPSGELDLLASDGTVLARLTAKT